MSGWPSKWIPKRSKTSRSIQFALGQTPVTLSTLSPSARATFKRTRSFREIRLLAELRNRKLPVPPPVAACYRRGLLTYSAALITERLPGARTLAEMLAAGRVDDTHWAEIGRCLRRFHDAGAQHADLNAHNIMLGENGEVWLLDFDRGRLRAPGSWSARVLDRLARSLAKISNGAIEWKSGFALLRLAHDA